MTRGLRSGMVAGAQRSVWVLRAVLVAGVMLALLAGAGRGYTPPLPVVLVVLLGALASAWRPEHLSLSLTLGVVCLFWALHLHARMPGSVLLAAAGLVVAHVSATLLAYGPPSLAVDPQLALLWLARALGSWSAALVVWVVARVYAGHGTPAVFWLAGLTAAVVAAVVAGLSVPLQDREREA